MEAGKGVTMPYHFLGEISISTSGLYVKRCVGAYNYSKKVFGILTSCPVPRFSRSSPPPPVFSQEALGEKRMLSKKQGRNFNSARSPHQQNGSGAPVWFHWVACSFFVHFVCLPSVSSSVAAWVGVKRGAGEGGGFLGFSLFWGTDRVFTFYVTLGREELSTNQNRLSLVVRHITCLLASLIKTPHLSDSRKLLCWDLYDMRVELERVRVKYGSMHDVALPFRTAAK